MVTSITANDSKHTRLVLGSRAHSAHKNLKQWKINGNIEMLYYYFIVFYKKTKAESRFLLNRK